jgi:Holliday junction resolvasome RuvABC endonuclease subunit
MVENRLKINIKNLKNDASDALAAALCHEQQFRFNDL